MVEDDTPGNSLDFLLRMWDVAKNTSLPLQSGKPGNVHLRSSGPVRDDSVSQ